MSIKSYPHIALIIKAHGTMRKEMDGGIVNPGDLRMRDGDLRRAPVF
jgi:hypothetical protein